MKLPPTGTKVYLASDEKRYILTMFDCVNHKYEKKGERNLPINYGSKL